MTDFKKTATQKNTKSTEEVREKILGFDKKPGIFRSSEAIDLIGIDDYPNFCAAYEYLVEASAHAQSRTFSERLLAKRYNHIRFRRKNLDLMARLNMVTLDNGMVTLNEVAFPNDSFYKQDKKFNESEFYEYFKEHRDLKNKKTPSGLLKNKASGPIENTIHGNQEALGPIEIEIQEALGPIDFSEFERNSFKKPNDFKHLGEEILPISDLGNKNVFNKNVYLINNNVVVVETPETAAATPTHDNNNNTLVIETHVQQGKPFTVSSFHEGNTPTAQPLQERRDEGMVGGYSSLTPSAQPLQALPAPSQANALRAQSQKQHHDMGVDIPMGEPHTGGMDDTKPTGMLFPTPKANPAPTTLVAPLPLNGQVKVKDNTAQGGGARAGGAAVEAEIKSLLESVVDSIDFSRLTDNKGNPIHDIDGLLPHAVRLAPRALLYRAEVAVVLVIYWASLPKYRTYGLRGENMDDTNHIRMMLDSERPLSDFVSLIQGYFADDYYLKNPHFRNLHKILGDGVPWNAKNRALARNTPAQGGVVRVTAAQRAAQNEQNHRECPDFEEPEMQAFLLREYCKDIKATPEEFFAMAGSEQGVITRLRTFYGTEVRPMWHIFGKEYSASKNSGQLSPVLRLAVGG